MPEAPSVPPKHTALLLLADGTVFYGYGIGTPGVTTGEVCFNTAMTGYQEILTDLSYAGQIITFTFPHIGNVGCNAEDVESASPAVRGLILREAITPPSNYRSEFHFNDWLRTNGITGICGIDTRALTISIREQGAKNVLIAFVENKELPDIDELMMELIRAPSLEGLELAQEVTTRERYEWSQTAWHLEGGYGSLGKAKFHVVAVDFGEKFNIARLLAEYGCRVTVVPATTSAADIKALKPDGVFLSNGPGDPAATGEYALPVIRELLDSAVPIFGICLGHQLLALAMGATTRKMYQGHRGANHPVQDMETGKVEITSQNHGFVVEHDTIPDDVVVTHRSLFDNSIEGLRHKTKPAFCVQYHPESSPGPHDSQYLFARFVEMMEKSSV